MNFKTINAQATPCASCAILLNILSKLGIDTETPVSCATLKPDDARQLKSRKEVIALLKISSSTYTRWKSRGILVPRVIGSRDYYTDDDLQHAFRECARKGKR